MGQKKLLRFEALKSFDNVLQYPENMKGRWNNFFHNDNPITLELACGKGEYSLGLGQTHPDRNFIGVDVKGNRQYIGAKKALENGYKNIAFLRTQIGRITEYFEQDEVEEIWIIFPDPFLKKEKNRLTYPTFLRLYQQILKPGGTINLKTDSPQLYEFTKEIIAAYNCRLLCDIPDVYAAGMPEGPLSIQTHYEGLHLADGRTIRYLQFALPEALIVPPVKTKKEKTEDIA